MVPGVDKSPMLVRALPVDPEVSGMLKVDGDEHAVSPCTARKYSNASRSTRQDRDRSDQLTSHDAPSDQAAQNLHMSDQHARPHSAHLLTLAHDASP